VVFCCLLLLLKEQKSGHAVSGLCLMTDVTRFNEVLCVAEIYCEVHGTHLFAVTNVLLLLSECPMNMEWELVTMLEFGIEPCFETKKYNFSYPINPHTPPPTLHEFDLTLRFNLSYDFNFLINRVN
jgi:hypothetical protein